MVENMKNIKYSVLLMLLSLVGCGKDIINDEQVIDRLSSQRIEFVVESVSDGRAVVMDNSNFAVDGNDFGVFATMQKGCLNSAEFVPNLFDNAQIVFNNGVWISNQTECWPQSSDTLCSFVAYSPYSPFVSATENGIKIPFVISLMCQEQYDLLYAVKKDINTPNNPIPLNFKHALSKVEFTITLNPHVDNITKVEIVEARVRNLYLSAVATIDPYSGDCLWSDYANVNTCVLFYGIIEPTQKTQLGEPMMLLPQDVDNVCVDLFYRVYSSANKDYVMKCTSYLLSANSVNVWHSNQSYVYNLTLTVSE